MRTETSRVRHWPRSPSSRWPISTPTTSKWQPASSKALRVRWASKWWRADPMAKLTKKHKILSTPDREKFYGFDEALPTLRQYASKFDEPVEVAMNLGVDPRPGIGRVAVRE